MSDPIDLHDLTDYSATSPRTMYNSSGNLVFAPMALLKEDQDLSGSSWSKTNVTITANAASTPWAANTADRFSHDAVSTAVSQNVTVITGAAYGGRLYFRYQDHQWLRIGLDGTNVWVDLQNQVVGTDNTSGATVVALADGAVEVQFEAEVAGDTTFTLDFALVTADNSTTVTTGTNAYWCGGTVYENGPYVSMDDVPEDERALVALTKYVPNKAVTIGSNLVSNGTFDTNTSGWTSGGTSTLTQSAGTLIVDRNGEANPDQICYQTIVTEAGAYYKLTVDVVDDGTDNVASVRVTRDTTGGTDLITAPSWTDGDGQSVYFQAGSSATVIHLSPGGSTTNTNTFDNITVTKVDRNPSAARFLPRRNAYIYKNGSWVRGLTWESEARTNKALYSEDLTNGAWVPSGLTKAASGEWLSLTSNGVTSFPKIPQTVSEGAGTYTLTYEVDTINSTGTYCDIGISGTGIGGSYTASFYQFDFATKALTIRQNGGASATYVEDQGNGVYRISVTWTATTVTAITIHHLWGDTTSGVVLYVRRPQLEAGSTPSSYIPTYGATRTRTAETLKDKADKIVWPNTTYVTGTELVTNGTFDTDSDWTKGTGWTIGSGVATKAAGTSSGLSQSGLIGTSREAYQVTLDVTRTAGTLWLRLGGSAVNVSTITASGTYTIYGVAEGTDTVLRLVGDASFVGSIDNISVKEINPRAKCVVMHGYMTYADENTFNQAYFMRQRADASNNLELKLDTSTFDGKVFTIVDSNGTTESSSSADAAYSEGINVPFKIATRWLDNAIQAATDGTATSEETATAVGLPDLSSTKTEWFYDFMGHVTDVLVYAEDIEEAGLTTLTARTLP